MLSSFQLATKRGHLAHSPLSSYQDPDGTCRWSMRGSCDISHLLAVYKYWASLPSPIRKFSTSTTHLIIIITIIILSSQQYTL